GIQGDAPASSDLALRLQAFSSACIRRDNANCDVRNARRDIENARADQAEANRRLSQFTGYLGPPGSGSSEPPSWVTDLVTASQAAFNKGQDAVASAVHTLNAAEERVAATAQAVDALIVPAPAPAAAQALVPIGAVEGDRLWQQLQQLVPRPTADASLHTITDAFPLPRERAFGSLHRPATNLQFGRQLTYPQLAARLFLPFVGETPDSGPRDIADEHQIPDVFNREVVARAAAITEVLPESVVISGFGGHPSSHTDFFVRVSVKVAPGDVRESFVVTEFKSPQGGDVWQPPVIADETSTVDEIIAADAEMTGVDFLLRTLWQVHRDVRDSAKDVPRIGRQPVNRKWALLSTFNETWVFRFEDDPVSLEERERDHEFAKRELYDIQHAAGPAGTSVATEAAAAAAAAAAAEGNAVKAVEHAQIKLDCADHAYISNCFYANNARPHVAAAVAYVAEQVAADMVDNPDDYIQVGGQQHQGGRQDMPTLSRTRKRKRATGTSSRTGTRTPRGRGRGRGQGGGARPAAGSASEMATHQEAGPQESERAQPERVLSGWDWLEGPVTIGDLLGDGRSGGVFAGTVAGKPVALKISREDASAKILLELAHEVAVYNHLVDFQGGEVAQLFGHGLLEVDGTTRAVLVLEAIKDSMDSTIAEGDRAALLPLSVRRQVIDTLGNLHQRRVIHGDPRMANVLIERADVPELVHGTTPDSSPITSPTRVRFVDLAFAEIDQDKEALDEDREGWGQVLELPEFE
ncbi:hypothetical protein IWW50_000321, partial [Coemansia erecta]